MWVVDDLGAFVVLGMLLIVEADIKVLIYYTSPRTIVCIVANYVTASENTFRCSSVRIQPRVATMCLFGNPPTPSAEAFKEHNPIDHKPLFNRILKRANVSFSYRSCRRIIQLP